VSDRSTPLRGLARLLVTVVVAVAVLTAAWFLFVEYPDLNATRLAGVVLVLLTGLVGLRVGASLASSLLPGHDVGEVAVEGPITRDGGGGPLPTMPTGSGADDVVEQIDRADADGNVEALILKLNTPGGQVVPSDDIRLAAERFEGPTVAYATDTCASGGYWIASGCDEIWARRGSIVGSIGVIGSRVNATEFAEKVGLSYERLAAGEYKDAGTPLKEMSEDEREYLQGLIDGYYEEFVDRVTEGRDLDRETVEDTEARVFLGPEAHEMGLVDRVGTRRELEDELAQRLGKSEVTVREFEPRRGIRGRLSGSARRVAYAFGAGVASVVGDDDDRFEFRV
jgi:protease-4